jgi:hypothetical protein
LLKGLPQRGSSQNLISVFCFSKTQALKFSKGLPQTREFPKSKRRCPVNSITDFFRFVKGDENIFFIKNTGVRFLKSLASNEGVLKNQTLYSLKENKNL